MTFQYQMDSVGEYETYKGRRTETEAAYTGTENVKLG